MYLQVQGIIIKTKYTHVHSFRDELNGGFQKERERKKIKRQTDRER